MLKSSIIMLEALFSNYAQQLMLKCAHYSSIKVHGIKSSQINTKLKFND